MSTRAQNIFIWRDTKKCFETGIYKDTPVVASIVYDNINPTIISRGYITEVVVNPLDTFTYCLNLLPDYNVVGLNLANQFHPGGGVDYGCFSQEENLFRRSNYHKTLIKKLYPIPEIGCLYSPQVAVIKDQDYQLMDKTYILPMIACAAIEGPKLTPQGQYAHLSDRELTKNRIRQIFRVAYLHDHDALVLGAFGAGAFKNPPKVVAEIFNEVMMEFKGCFRLIAYAVKSHKDSNYDIFKDVIQTTS